MLTATVAALAVAGGLGLFFWIFGAQKSAEMDSSGRRRTQELLQHPEMRSRLGLAPLEVAAPVEEKGVRRRARARSVTTEDLPAKGLQADLIRADLKLRPIEFWGMSFGAGIGTFLLILVSGRGEMFAIALGLVGFYAPRWYVSRRKNGRRKKFVGQLADSLGVMAVTLRSGGSVQQAIQAVATNAEPPIRDEFARLVKEVSVVGMPMEKALAGMVNRVQSTDLEFVAIAIKINQEVGGNLADILESVADTIREREKLQGKVKALTAQAEITIKVMTGMPILAALAIGLMKPQAWAAFTEGLCGRIVIAIAVTLILIGYFLAKKMGTVKA